MKKYFTILTILLALLAFSGPAFALEITADATTEIGDAIYVPSTNVRVKALASTTEYAAQSKHDSGNKIYGTLYDASDIKVQESSVGTECPAPGGNTSLSSGTWE